MNNPQLAKFRPSFDENEIQFLYLCVNFFPAGEQEAIHQRTKMLRKLAVLKTKIQVGAIDPSYELKDWMRELGFTDKDLPAMRQVCYARWRNNDILRDYEIEMAKTYAWENGLMTPEEQQEFESANTPGG